MSKSRNLSIGAALAAIMAASPLMAEKLGLGRPALPEEIAAWDLDVRPDGTGLPAGSGDVLTGEEIFAEKCAACHGDFAEGVDNWPKLAGGFDTLDRDDPVKTVGSFWPYLSTTWDYVNRSMPFGNAQSLSTDEVYAIVAYILYSNDLVDEDFTLSDENFLDVEMPNAGGFIVDDRADAEHAAFSAEPCMQDCKDSVEITMRAAVLDVTPQEASDGQDDSATAEPAAETQVVQVAAADPALIADGKKAFKKCAACHQVGDGAKNKTGPLLNGVVGAAAGAAEGFRYSKALAEAAGDGLVWGEAELTEFLTKPRAFLKGTKMSFAGFRKQSDIDAVIAYLGSFPK